MASPQEWYAALPPVTKFWFTAAVLSTIGGRLNMFDVSLLALQIWDLYSNFKQVRSLSLSLHPRFTTLRG